MKKLPKYESLDQFARRYNAETKALREQHKSKVVPTKVEVKPPLFYL